MKRLLPFCIFLLPHLAFAQTNKNSLEEQKASKHFTNYTFHLSLSGENQYTFQRFESSTANQVFKIKLFAFTASTLSTPSADTNSSSLLLRTPSNTLFSNSSLKTKFTSGNFGIKDAPYWQYLVADILEGFQKP